MFSNADITEVLQLLNIPADFDLLLVGDGSGSRQGFACGFGCVSVSATDGIREWSGGFSSGTVNLAEAMAYVAPLEFYAAQAATRGRICQTHIVSDSAYVRQVGSGHRLTVHRNAGVWSALDAYARLGFQLHWHWVERDRLVLHRRADQLSKLARHRVAGEQA